MKSKREQQQVGQQSRARAKLDRRLGPSFVRHSELPESYQGDLYLSTSWQSHRNMQLHVPAATTVTRNNGQSQGKARQGKARQKANKASKAGVGAPCHTSSHARRACLSPSVQRIMKMSILAMNEACLLLLLMAARNCSSFLAPPDNCGARCRSRCDRAVKSAYSGGRCIDGSRHLPSALGKCHSPLRITPVEQLDFETGEVINSFPSATEAARALGISREGVSDVLNGRGKSSGGFFWRRSGDDAMPPARTYGGMPIEQVDLETGKVINVFPSSAEAARSLGINGYSIRRIVNGEIDRISYKGYLWRKVGDKKVVPRKERRPPIPQGKQKVEQIDYETGTVLAVFDSINEAAASLNIPSRRIRDTIIGRQKSTGGFTFRKIGKAVPHKRSTKRRPVEQLCLETGKVLATYQSQKAAGEALGVSSVSINSAARGINSKSSAGYAWRYVESET